MIVVSRWDNIVGPQCVYLWTEEVTSLYYPSILPSKLSGIIKYVTDHTVDHQDVIHHTQTTNNTAINNSISPSTQRTSLCLVPELNLVYISISLRVPSEMDTVLEFASSSSMTANDPDQPATSIPHAVAILGDLKHLSHFLLLRPLMISWLNEFGPKIGVLVCKNKLQSSMINSWCAELCKTIITLKTCWVQEKEEEKESFHNNAQSIKNNGHSNDDTTTFIEPKYKKNAQIMETNKKKVIKNEENATKTRIVHLIEYLPPNLRHVPSSSWSLLLTSHLSTFGSSIIVGFDNLAVNQVIRFLLCFSSNEEGYCSRYSLASLPDTFMKGLLIQGLALGGMGERSISYNQIQSNRLPLTYVELGSKFILKQIHPQSHSQFKANILMEELRALWTSSGFKSPPIDPYAELVKEGAGFVSHFMTDLTQLPSHRRYGLILLFRRMLHAKAMALITYLHSIRHLPKADRSKLCRLIPEMFNYDEQEYTIVQVTAEKLKPGIFKLLF